MKLRFQLHGLAQEQMYGGSHADGEADKDESDDDEGDKVEGEKDEGDEDEEELLVKGRQQ